jgi:uncharacterized protein
MQLSISKKNTLVDAGPLVAAFNKNDHFHATTVNFLRAYRGSLLTTWPVLAEACHLLRRAPQERMHLLQWVERGGLDVFESLGERVTDVVSYMGKYADVPMDLGDASIVIAAVETGVRDIASVDSNFDIYRLPGRARLRNVLR